MRWRAGGFAAGALLAGLLAGSAVGFYLGAANPDWLPALGQAPAGRVDQAALDQAVRVLQAHYVDQKLDYTKLTRGGIRGMIESLNDPNSEYLDPDQYRRQQDSFAGRYTGIGIYVSFRADYPQITGVVPGSPAEKAGIKTDDVIVKVDGKDARGLRADQASAEIQGPEGTRVTLTLRRGADTFDVGVVRARIKLPFVLSSKLEGGVLYLRIFSFGDNSSSELDSQLASGLPGAKAVVLDLRDDPGGFISSADDIISRFLSSGETFELRDRTGTVERHQVSGSHPAAAVPLVVVVNANSASASEIVAGSLQVHGRARLVGTRTYGKATVQQDYPLPGGGDLHITIKRWYLPNGTSVDKRGLQPDVEVALASSDRMFNVTRPDLGHAADDQLNRALALVTGG